MYVSEGEIKARNTPSLAGPQCHNDAVAEDEIQALADKFDVSPAALLIGERRQKNVSGLSRAKHRSQL